MGKISSYSLQTAANLDGTEYLPIVDSGTTMRITLNTARDFLRINENVKPTVQATATSMPTSTPLTAGIRNLWWLNTTSGSINLSSLGDIGLPKGCSAIFRKTSADANVVKWTGTVGGTSLTKSMTVILDSHYNADQREIELVWDGATWTLVGSPGPQNLASELDWTGATDQRSAFQTFLNQFTAGTTIQLPQGTILIDGGASNGNLLTIPALRIVGHPKGTTIKFTNPGGSHTPIRGTSGMSVEDVTFQWDTSSLPAAASDCGLFFGLSLDPITFRRCKFFGPAPTGTIADGSQLYWLGSCSPVKLWGCKNVTFDECEVARSIGTDYGLEIIGGSYHVYRNCYFHHNSADGCKIFGNGTYGQPSNMRFLGCRSDYNGQIIIQGQTVYTNTYTTGTTITPVNGARYLVNGTFNLVLNNGTTGDAILVSKLIGSGTCTLKRADGTTTIATLDSTYDRNVIKLVFSGGNWSVTASPVTNGEGWDMTGSDMLFADCTATGNEGAQFQVKPTFIDAVGKNAASNIRFVGCTGRASWNANGFGIVNNISSGEVSPQGITFTDCVAESNKQTGFILSSGTLPIFCVSMANCIARDNGGDGISIAALTRSMTVHGCHFLGNGTNGSGWNAKLYAAKGVKFTDCYFSGVDPVAQSLVTEAAVNTAGNARCYGILLDKSSGGTMADCQIVDCRFHNHLTTSSVTTDIRFYTSGSHPVQDDYSASISASRLAFGTGGTGVISLTGHQSTTLTTTLSASAYSGGTAYIVGDFVTNGGLIYKCIQNTTGNAPPTSPTTTNTYWTEMAKNIVSFV